MAFYFLAFWTQDCFDALQARPDLCLQGNLHDGVFEVVVVVVVGVVVVVVVVLVGIRVGVESRKKWLPWNFWNIL